MSFRILTVCAFLFLPFQSYGQQGLVAKPAAQKTFFSQKAKGTSSSDEPVKPGKKSSAQKTPSNSRHTAPVSLEGSFNKNLAKDQLAIWTSPRYLRPKDALWLLPLGGLTGVTIATDQEASRRF